MNKIKYGLKNVHYAVITDNNGVISYGTPKRLPGAVNLTLNPKGELSEFYADDMAYFIQTANQGYEGTLEIALIPDTFRVDVLKDEIDQNGALFENAEAVTENIALLYEFAGDKKATRHVNYNVTVARPSVESETKGATITPKTETLNITASPATDTKFVKGRLLQGQNGYETFYGSVYLKNQVENTVAVNTATFVKNTAANVDIDATSTDPSNTIKNVKIDGINVGGVNLTITDVDVSIEKTYIATLDNGVHTILVEFEKGNAITVTLTVKATA